MRKDIFTILTFVRINTKRFFRDKTAMFFTILFPLIFLIIFGGIFGGSNDVSFNVGIFNNSSSESGAELQSTIAGQAVFSIDEEIQTLEAGKEKMNRGQLDALITIPEGYGNDNSGSVLVQYTQNNQQAGETLKTILQNVLLPTNETYTDVNLPFTVTTEQLSEPGLSSFDYTFAGLLGFSIIGVGIFGPINIFPELKKMGILRRLHTTPLRVGQYFSSMVLSQVIVGLLSVGIQFAVALTFFDLNLVGNVFELSIFLLLGIVTILGIGLALGGWAKNERQAAPLSNLIVFPMMFLSGTFFPRFLMPEWLQRASDFLPLTPVIDGLRLIATEGKHLHEIGPQVGLLVVWMVVIYIIALRVFRWE